MNKQVKSTTMSAKGNIIVQVMSGENIDVLVDGETVYVPMAGIDFSPLTEISTPSLSTEVSEKEVSEDSPTEPVSEDPISTTRLKPMTLDELKDLSSAEIQELLEDSGVEIPTEGKNTHKKMRELYLDSMDSDVDEEEAEEEAPKPKAKGIEKASSKKADPEKSMRDAITKAYDTGEDGDADSAVEAIKEFVGEDLADDAEEAFNKQWADNETDAESCIDAVMAVVSPKGEESDEEESDAPSGVETPVTKLKVGDRVSCYWVKDDEGGELNDWFDGEVTELVKKGRKVVGAVVTYDGEEEEGGVEINTELVTRIIVLSE